SAIAKCPSGRIVVRAVPASATFSVDAILLGIWAQPIYVECVDAILFRIAREGPNSSYEYVVTVCNEACRDNALSVAQKGAIAKSIQYAPT
ncbi:hypothetical protein HDU82_004012, partial [Entophlyctis luteolus]